jgi:hypothetical protein
MVQKRLIVIENENTKHNFKFIGDPRLPHLGLILKFPYDWDESDTVLKRMVSLSSQHREILKLNLDAGV